MNLEVVSGILGWSAPPTEFWEAEVCFYVWLSQRCVQCPVPLVSFFASRRGIQNLPRRWAEHQGERHVYIRLARSPQRYWRFLLSGRKILWNTDHGGSRRLWTAVTEISPDGSNILRPIRRSTHRLIDLWPWSDWGSRGCDGLVGSKAKD